MGYLGYFSTIGLGLAAASLLAAAIAAGLRAARAAAPAPASPANVIPFPHPDLARREQLTAAQAFDEALIAARSRSSESRRPWSGDGPAPSQLRTPGFHRGRRFDD